MIILLVELSISGTYEGAVSSLKLYVDGNPISNDPVMDNGNLLSQ